MEGGDTDNEQSFSIWKLRLALTTLKLAQLAIIVRIRTILRRKRPEARLWKKPYCGRGMFQRYSDYHNIVWEAELNNGVTFFNQMRMSTSNFELLAQKLGHVGWFKKRDTILRKCIPLGNDNTFDFQIFKLI